MLMCWINSSVNDLVLYFWNVFLLPCDGKTKSWASRQQWYPSSTCWGLYQPQHRQILEVTLQCERKAWTLHPCEHRQHRHVITITVFFQTSSIYLIPVMCWLHDAPFDVGGIKTVSRKELKRQQCGVCLFIKFFIFTKSRSSCSSSGISRPFFHPRDNCSISGESLPKTSYDEPRRDTEQSRKILELRQLVCAFLWRRELSHGFTDST